MKYAFMILAALWLLLPSSSESAVQSTLLEPHFYDCDCSVEGKLYLLVHDNDDSDRADNVYINIWECITFSFCINELNSPDGYVFVDESFPIGSTKWGLNPLKTLWGGNFQPSQGYCVKTDDDYEIKDTVGGTSKPTISLKAKICANAPPGDPGNCGIGNP